MKTTSKYQFIGVEISNDAESNIDKREKVNIPKRNVCVQKVFSFAIAVLSSLAYHTKAMYVARVGLTKESATHR